MDEVKEEISKVKEKVAVKEELRYSLANIATEHQQVIADAQEEKYLTTNDALIEILNRIERLEKLIG